MLLGITVESLRSLVCPYPAELMAADQSSTLVNHASGPVGTQRARTRTL